MPYLQASLLNHIWRALVEKAGAKVEDIPKTWDARYDFFKGLQKKLREQGMRNMFGVGFIERQQAGWYARRRGRRGPLPR